MYGLLNASDEARHSAAHVVAMAVLKKFPKAKVGIGPVTREGFYYEFDINRKIKPKDLEVIEKEANRIRGEKLDLTQMIINREEAVTMLLQRGQIYKVELIKNIPDLELSFYKLGDFIDLCRGPHVKNTKELGPIKILKSDESHWNNDITRPLMQRVYGVVFNNEGELEDFLKTKEEEKNRKFTNILENISLGKLVGNSILLNESGSAILNKIENLYDKHILNDSFYDIYVNNVDNLKECFEHLDNAFLSKPRNNKEFPITLKTSCVIEDDFLNSDKQSHRSIIVKKYLSGIELFDLIGSFNQYIQYFKSLLIDFKVDIYSSDKEMEFIESLSNIFKNEGISNNKIILNTSDGIRIVFKGIDVLKRDWNLSSVIIDHNTQLGSLSNLTEVSMEINPFRLFAFELENTKGKLPKILSPNEVIVIPINKNYYNYALDVCRYISDLGYISDTDTTSKSLNRKIFLASQKSSSVQVVVGEKEMNNNSVSLRFNGNDLGLIKMEDVPEYLIKLTSERDI